MLKLVVSDEENCRRDALVSLGNLAIIGQNQLLIVKLGGLPFIVKVSFFYSFYNKICIFLNRFLFKYKKGN